MNGLTQDVRFALRMLLKSPGFTLVVVVVMGLGIGVNASIFAIVRGVLFGQLPFDAQRVVVVENISTKQGAEPFEVSFPDFIDYRQRARSFESMAAWTESQAYLTLGSEPERFTSTVVSPALLATLGMRPMLGRSFLPEEEQLGKQYTSVIIGYRIWKDRLGSDPHVLGRTLKMNGRVRTIVGVMPPGFRFPEISDFWIPLAYKPTEELRGAHYLSAAGRLRPGVTPAQARAEVASISAQLAKEYPATNEGVRAIATPYLEFHVRGVRPSMIMLMCAVLFVLLIACANVANLMLARASSRQRELTVRIALGAGRGRIARQLLTESVLTGLLGGTLGILIAYWANDLVLSTIPVELPYWMKFDIDAGVLAFTAMLSVASGLLFGLAPVVPLWRPHLYESLKEGGLSSGTGRGHQRLRNGLVVSEIALAMVLLIGAGLMIRSFMRMQEIRGGFDPEGVLVGRVTLPVAVYPQDDDRRRFFSQLLPSVRALPGVESASAGGHVPLGRDGSSVSILREGHEHDGHSSFPLTSYSVVMPGYFSTLRIPLRQGRDFTPDDKPGAPRVAIVNEAAARELWPGEDALGKRFKLGADDTASWATVVGVVGDVRQHIQRKRVSQVYTAHAQDAWQTLFLVARTRGNPAAFTAPIRNLLKTRDPDLPFYEASTLRDAIHKALWEQRIYAWMMGAYSFIALLIAAVGIYGVMAYRVAQRTQEIGIRMAIGAPQGAVLRMVVGQGLRLTLLGLGLGLAAAFAVTRMMASLLFGINPNDPPTFTGVAVILAASALLASFLPAWRASQVDPMTALRHE